MIRIFHELIQSYPTWPLLEEFLESEAGGGFRVIDSSEDGLSLIRYEKDVTDMSRPHSKWFRSVVWDREAHRPVCMAPPKSAADAPPFLTWQEAAEAGGLVCQEWLEGFMINVVRRAGEDTVRIVSRSRLDASGRFYSKKTFEQLFMEAYLGTTVEPDEPLTALRQEVTARFPCPDPSKGERAVFVSFMVHHPEHRVVQLHTEARVWGIHQGVVDEEGVVSCVDSPSSPHWNALTSIPHPEEGDIASWMKTQQNACPWNIQGFVLKDTHGNRWKYPCAEYATVHSLRGNTPYGIDRFMMLYLQRLVPLYLQYYPEDTDAFRFHSEQMLRLTEWIHLQYRQLHVLRSTTLGNIDKMFHSHLYALHGMYLTHFRDKKKKLTCNDVYDYLMKQPWPRIVFLLRRWEDSYLEGVRQESASVA